MPQGGRPERPRLLLYGRNYCHLCTDMLAGLESLRSEFDFNVEVIDVDGDPALDERYGELVPVLMHAGAELCHYHLDTGKIRAYLSKFR